MSRQPLSPAVVGLELPPISARDDLPALVGIYSLPWNIFCGIMDASGIEAVHTDPSAFMPRLELGDEELPPGGIPPPPDSRESTSGSGADEQDLAAELKRLEAILMQDGLNSDD